MNNPLGDLVGGHLVPRAFATAAPWIPPMLNSQTAAQANYASVFHEQLMGYITEFESSLDPQHDVGVRLVSFGQSFEFHLEEMGYHNPSLISFSGTTRDGNGVMLIQHVSQISILLMKLPLLPDGRKRTIGFEAAPAKDGRQSDEQ